MEQPAIDLRLQAEIDAEKQIGENLLRAARDTAVGALYYVACLMIGAEGWKAACIGAMIAFCLLLGLARQVIMRAGIFFIPYAALLWIGIAPDPGSIKSWACR